MLREIAAVTCRHTSAPLTAMPGRGLHLTRCAPALWNAALPTVRDFVTDFETAKSRRGVQACPQAAQLPRRDRGRDLLPEASLRFGPLHLARARSLQDLHLVRGGRAQPGTARPSQIGIAPAQTGSFGDSRRKQTSLSTLARQTIPSVAAAISTRKAESTRQ